MKKASSFRRFEFCFVVSVIGIVVLVAVQRYMQLADDVRRLNFEVIAKHFTTAVYNYRAGWIMAQQHAPTQQLSVDGGMTLYFSAQGWPLVVLVDSAVLPHATEVSINSCLSLWQHCLSTPPAISYAGGDPYGSRPYHLNLSPAGACQFELITKYPHEFYVEYTPRSGAVVLQAPSTTRNY